MGDTYDDLKKHFGHDSEVDVASGRGAQGIKYKGKMFVMFYKGDITVKLSPQRVSDLIKSGEALPHDPGTGNPVKDRALIPASMKENWISMCTESKNYVKK